ncbi:MAG: phage tail protein [Polaromonas sp.]
MHHLLTFKKLRQLGAGCAFLATVVATPAQAQDCMMGELRMFAGNFAPRNWALAQGQIMSIQQNTALFSILGTTYGGDGRTTFGLPNLSSRVPVGVGAGPGLTPRSLGEQGGSETVTLTSGQLPSHTHTLSVSSSPATTGVPAAGTALAASQNAGAYGSGVPNTVLHSASVGIAGSSQPVPTLPPYLGMNYIICLYGIFPQRN